MTIGAAFKIYWFYCQTVPLMMNGELIIEHAR